jgi:hypothetical protein
MNMKTYDAWIQDDLGDTVIEAESMEAAVKLATEWVRAGDWGEFQKTKWVDFSIQEQGSDHHDEYTVTIDPKEPECAEDCTHEWVIPIEVVGGVKENPGVYGHGGGVTMTSICKHCGWYRIIDTWAQRPDNGEQGLEGTEYREPDDKSLAYVEQERET